MLYCSDFNKNGNNVILTRSGEPIRDELRTISQIGIQENEILFAIEQTFNQR